MVSIQQFPIVVDNPVSATAMSSPGPAFCIIKPHVIASGLMGMMISKLEAHWRIVHLKHDMLLPWQVQELYKHHRDKPFWPRLEAAMTFAPAVPILLAAHWHDVREYTMRLRAELPTSVNTANNYLHSSESGEDVYRELEVFIPEWQTYWNNPQEH